MKKSQILMSLLLVILLSSCYASRITYENLSIIQRGMSSKEVIAIMGKPSYRSFDEESEMLEFRTSESSIVGVVNIWFVDDRVTKMKSYHTNGCMDRNRAIEDKEEEESAKKEKKEKEEEERMRKEDEPYKGMKEKYINITLLGRAKEKRTEHYWRDTPGKRTQDIQYRYMWYNSNGAKKFMAVCRNGLVSSVVEFVSSTTSGKKTYRGNTSRNNDRKDMYDVQDYDDPEDFYYDHADEFDDIQDAEDYWEEAQ